MKFPNKIITLILILIFSTTISFAQKNLPRLSPKCYVGQTIGYTNVEINYSSPGVKNRSIWGKLVPYNSVWRVGANEATTIEFDNDILINGNKISAGKYSLFTIPGKSEWTVILNNAYDQWGSFKYSKKDDIIRFKVVPKKNDFVERLKFSFNFKEPYISEIVMEWETLKITFDIKTNVPKQSKL